MPSGKVWLRLSSINMQNANASIMSEKMSDLWKTRYLMNASSNFFHWDNMFHGLYFSDDYLM